MRERHLERCSPDALVLYLILVIFADAQSLSHYAFFYFLDEFFGLTGFLAPTAACAMLASR